MYNYDAAYVISVRNKQAYLAKTIKTIFKDNGSLKIQLVIVDDGSDDHTGDIIKWAKGKYGSAIKSLKNNSNKGISYSLNKAHKYVDAPYILVASGDDLYDVDRAKKTVEFFKEHSNVDVCYGSFARMNRAGQVIEVKLAKNFSENRVMLYDDYGQFIPHGFMAFKTECVKNVKYNEDRKVGIDHEFILDLYEAGYKFKEMRQDDFLGFYLMVPKCVTSQHIDEIREEDRKMLAERRLKKNEK